MRKIIPLLSALFLAGCWRIQEFSAEMMVVRTAEGKRVVGFLPADILRERAYFFVLMAPLRLYFVSSTDTVPVYADIHVLTMDKQRRIDRAFLVSDPVRGNPEEGRLIMKRLGRAVGIVHLSLSHVEPHVRLDSVKSDTFRGKHHVYVFTTAFPAARNYPYLIAVKGGDTLRLVPVERAKFLTRYHGRQYHMYQEWYDIWTFVARADTPLTLSGYALLFRGELFGVGDTTVPLRRF